MTAALLQAPGPIPQPLIEAPGVSVGRLIARAVPEEGRAAGVGLGMKLALIDVEAAGRRETIAGDLRRSRVDHVTLLIDGPWLRGPGRQLR